MFALDYTVTINGKKFSGINGVKIKRGIASLAGTCTIKVPTTAVQKKTDGSRLNVLTAQTIKRGDKVVVDLGYNGKLRREFTGYVTRVNYTKPLEIECEDSIFLLREKTIKKKYKDTTLDNVLADILAGTGIKVTTGGISIKIDSLLLMSQGAGDITRELALQTIIDRYGLVGYFDTEGNLFVGLRQGKKAGEVKLRLGWNTIKDDELKYHNKDEQSIQIKAIYINKLGVRTEAVVGDKGGAIRTIFLPDVSDKTQLETIAKNELEKYKFTGYAGKIKAFLVPFAEPGYVARIADPQYQQRNGSYYVEGVEVEFSTSGGRRTIEIGAQV